MEIIVTLAKGVAASLAGVLATILIAEPLRERLLPYLTVWGTKKSSGIIGTWRAEFLFGHEGKSHIEIIELKYSLGLIVGKIIPSKENYNEIRKIEHRKPIRVRGSVRDNQFFSGTWFHPLRRSHHTGSFDLLINRNHDHMEGKWLGYSERRNQIESQSWIWTRIESGELSADRITQSRASSPEDIDRS